MKNLKKVLAMVLAFACTFTMFASAKVYEDVQPGTEFSEAITMLSDLGIIQGKTDGKYHPEETITRAEACALIARLLTGDPNVSNFGGAQNFTDVVKGSWQESAVGYCVANGITVGVGKGKFEPNRAINDQEFLTMLVRALGYETPDMKQGYPFSYMSAARAIGLVDNTQMLANTDALRGEDAQVIYNAMFVDYAKGAKMINTTHGTSVEKYPTLAESVWGLNRAALGTFTGKDDEEVTLSNCKAHTWVIVGTDKKAEGRILAYPIDDDTTDIYKSDVKAVNNTQYVPYSFKYEGDADALKGYQVELWGEGKHGTPTWEKGEGKFVYSDKWNIKAIKTVSGQTKYDYDASKADSKSDNGTIELGESKLDLKSVADNAAKVTAMNTTATPLTTYLSNVKYNGETVTKGKEVEKALNVRDGAQYKLMDWDSDGDIDWVVVDEANYFKVESASSKRVTVTSMKSSDKDGDEEKQTASETLTWKLDGLNDKKDYKVKYEVPEGLKEGDILEVTYKTAYDKGEKCEVVTATVKVVDAENHELDKVSTKNHLVLTFDGETKQLAQNKVEGDIIVPKNPTKYENFDEEELGTAFALHMNRNGFIVYSDYANDTSNYMMVLDTDDGKNTVRGELGALKILTSNNKVENNVEVVSDLMIDRKTSGNGYDKDSRHFDEHLIVGNVYKYWKNADGKITKLESVVDGKHSAMEYEYISKNDRLTLDRKESYALKDANVIFAVKPHNGGNGYIQHVSANDLKVDDADVLAVKQQDIPDIAGIGAQGDTKIALLDGSAEVGKSWLGSQNKFIAYKSQKNKDIDGAILGVDNFNKFNAGATKIGLVTDVSYDKNDIVSIEVATNGKVETLSSVEKTKFDDVVSVYEYANKKSYSLAGRNETIKNGLAKGQSLKDYLNKNAAYAEITTNADGKLTGVLFMDTKNGEDAADGAVNAGNVVAGRYYQVSRKVIADVKEGKWLSTVKDTVQFTSNTNLYTLDSKNVQKASDFAGDAAYYTIDGRPTINGLKSSDYASKAMSILNGFDGNPTVKVGAASDVQKSEIRNDNTANDLYNVADVASKIDKNGEGDIVAVYAYGKYMGEDTTKPKPVVPVKKFNVTGVQFGRLDGTPSNDLKTLTGHNNQFVVYVGGDEVAEKTVGLKMQTVGAGTPEQKGKPVTGLTKENFQVTFGGADAKKPVVTDATAVAGQPGYYTLTLDTAVDTKHAVTVTVVAGGNAASIAAGGVKVEDNQPEIGGGEGGAVVTPADGLSYNITSVAGGNKTVVLEFFNKNTPVNVNSVVVAGEPTANVVCAGNKVTIGSANDLSGKTLIVDGTTITLPTLTDGKGAALEGLATPVEYKKNSKTGTAEVELTADVLTKVNMATNTEVTVTSVPAVASLKLNTANKLVATADDLNNVTGTELVVTVSAPGAQNLTVKIPLRAADDITLSEVVPTVTQGNKDQVKASALYPVQFNKEKAGKILVEVNGDGSVKAVEADLTNATDSKTAAEAIKSALETSKYNTNYTFTTEKAPAKAAGEIYAVKIESKNFTAKEVVSLKVADATSCVTFDTPVVVEAQDKTAGKATVKIPARISKDDAGEWTLKIGSLDDVKVTLAGTETPDKVALAIARAAQQVSTVTTDVDVTLDPQDNTVVVITEKTGKEGQVLKTGNVTFAKNATPPAAETVTVAPQTFNFTKDTDVSGSTHEATVTYNGKGELKIWKSGESFPSATQTTINDVVKGVNVELKSKKITLTGTPADKTTAAVKFYVGTSEANKAELSITVQDTTPAPADPTITLGAATKTINVLTADGDATKETTVAIGNEVGGETVVVAQDVSGLAAAGDNATVNNLKATWTSGKLTITGTPNKAGNAVFHLAVKKAGNVVDSSKTTFTVTVEKVKADDLTPSAQLNVGKDAIEITLAKKTGGNLSEDEVKALGFKDQSSDATGYTVNLTAATSSAQANKVTVTGKSGKIEIGLNPAMQSGETVNKIVLLASDFIEAITIDNPGITA